MKELAIAIVGVGLSGIVGIVGWMCNRTYAKLAEIETSLVEMKLDMAKIQASLFSREEIREMIQLEIAKHEKRG